MSVQAISWALSVDAGSTAAKCVLITLANYADASGICWPTQSLIAKQTEQSVDTVQRRLKDLEAVGLIARERRQRWDGVGGRLSDRYRLTLTPQSAAKGVKPQSAADPYTATRPPLNRTAAAINEPSTKPIISKKDNRTISGKRGKPKHLAKNKDRVWCDVGTEEWTAYANDYREAHNGHDPPLNWSNSGAWFNILGESKAA